MKILPGPPFTKEGVEIFPLWKRGIEGDFPLCELTLFIKRNKATKQSQEKISNVDCHASRGSARNDSFSIFCSRRPKPESRIPLSLHSDTNTLF
jgi:hypothetical protein